MDDLYCKVHLDTSLSTTELKAALSSLLDANFSGRTIRANSLVIDLFENRAVKPSLGIPRSAAYSPHYLEVEPTDDSQNERKEFIDHINQLLTTLRRSGIRSVASCDFEDQLSKE